MEMYRNALMWWLFRRGICDDSFEGFFRWESVVVGCCVAGRFLRSEKTTWWFAKNIGRKFRNDREHFSSLYKALWRCLILFHHIIIYFFHYYTLPRFLSPYLMPFSKNWFTISGCIVRILLILICVINYSSLKILPVLIYGLVVILTPILRGRILKRMIVNWSCR